MEAISRYLLTDNNYGVQFTTKNISYIAMMTAVAVAVTVVISVTIPITVLPPIRVAFEGIMIKLAGMFFGPLVGVIVGLATEGLTILFVPSYIHPAYLVTAVIFGFLSGVTSYAQRLKGKKVWWTFGMINFFVVVYGLLMTFAISSYDQDVKVFGALIPSKYFWIFFVGSLSITLLMVWITTFTCVGLKRYDVLETILPIIFLAVVAEYMCTSLIASWGNANFLGTPRDGGYSSLMTTALIMAPLKVLSNSIILSTVFYVLRPLILNKKDHDI